MKKITFFLFIGMILIASIYAQAPQEINYQALVRDTNGVIISNQNIRLRISILSDSISGAIVYTETHNSCTNSFGLVNIAIGTGQIESGDFIAIDWGNSSHFIKTEMDESGGANYQLMGTSQLLSVPYSNYSATTGDTSMWKKDPPDIYYKKGNVGIGTNSPTENLHIDGGFKLSDGSQGKNKVLTSNASGKTSWKSVNNVNKGFSNPTSPDGTDGIIPVTVKVNLSSHYTVPNGMNFYILNIFNMNNNNSLLINSNPITLGLYNCGTGTFSQRLSNPIVVGPRSIINSSDTIITINGYLVGLSSGGSGNGVSSSSDTSFNCGAAFFDERDNHIYTTIQIGTQCWMAENLAYLPDINSSFESSDTLPHYYVYDFFGFNVAEAKGSINYQVYGVLYNWPAALAGEASSNNVPSGVRGICPAGWHLPSDQEWKILEGEVDSQYGYPDKEWENTGYRGTDAGENLQETGNIHWAYAYGTNTSGFTALPGGHQMNCCFMSLTHQSYFWTSMVYNNSQAWNRSLNTLEKKAKRWHLPNNWGLSVRCIKDN